MDKAIAVNPMLGNTIGRADSSFVVAEWTEDPCPAEGIRTVAPIHLHRECDEAWYVLEGRLSFEVDGEELTAEAGGAVFVPRGVKHTYWNPDPAPARYLLIMTEKTKRLIDAIHSTEDRNWARLKMLFNEHDAELID